MNDQNSDEDVGFRPPHGFRFCIYYEATEDRKGGRLCINANGDLAFQKDENASVMWLCPTDNSDDDFDSFRGLPELPPPDVHSQQISEVQDLTAVGISCIRQSFVIGTIIGTVSTIATVLFIRFVGL